MGNIFGYIRVSSRDQNEDRQLIALKELAIPEKNIFIDKQSGKDFKRPQYRKMIRRVRKDDLLYIKSYRPPLPKESFLCGRAVPCTLHNQEG